MAVHALNELPHASRFEPLDKPLWRYLGGNNTSAGVASMTPSGPPAGASLAILFQLEVRPKRNPHPHML